MLFRLPMSRLYNSIRDIWRTTSLALPFLSARKAHTLPHNRTNELTIPATAASRR